MSSPGQWLGRVTPEPPLWQQYLIIVVGLGGLAFMAALMPSYWRRPNKNFLVTPVLWVWGDALWRGFVRAVPAVTLGMVIVMGMLLYGFIVGGANVNAIVGWTWFVALMVESSACVSIALFNWPKFLVPPYLRDQPGAVSEWLQARRSRSKRASDRSTP